MCVINLRRKGRNVVNTVPTCEILKDCRPHAWEQFVNTNWTQRERERGVELGGRKWEKKLTRVREKNECDQNTLYKVLKELTKTSLFCKL